MSTSSIPSFNFSGFMESNHYISYKKLFASEAPQLKERDLCPFLLQMDQEEYQIITQENAELNTAQNAQQEETENKQYYWRIGKYAMIGLGVLTFLGSLYFAWKAQGEQAKCQTAWKAIREYENKPENHQIIQNRYRGVEGEEAYQKFRIQREQLMGPYPYDIANSQVQNENLAQKLDYTAKGLTLSGLGCALAEPVVGYTDSPKDHQIGQARNLRLLDKIRRIELRIKAIQNIAEQIQLGQALDYFNQFKPAHPNNIIHHEHDHNHYHYA